MVMKKIQEFYLKKITLNLLAPKLEQSCVSLIDTALLEELIMPPTLI